MNKIIQSQSEFSKIMSFSASKLGALVYIVPTAEKILTNPLSRERTEYFIVSPNIDTATKSKDIDVFVDELLKIDPALNTELVKGRQWVASEVYADAPVTLKTLRLKAGLSQKELADNVGIQQPNISEMECGKRKPTLDTVRRLAEALGIGVEEVLRAFQ